MKNTSRILTIATIFAALPCIPWAVNGLHKILVWLFTHEPHETITIWFLSITIPAIILLLAYYLPVKKTGVVVYLPDNGRDNNPHGMLVLKSITISAYFAIALAIITTVIALIIHV